MSRTPPETDGPVPRLYLVAPSAVAAINEAARHADIAAVLLKPGAGDLGPLVAAVRAAGAACLIEGDVALADRLGADGAHLDGPAALKAALPALRPHGIAGAGGLRSRHEAMTAAELGADYVMFGELDAAGRRPDLDTVAERISWWQPIFEVPCVGYAESRSEAEALIAAGADFIAVGGPLLEDAASLAALAPLRAGVR
ncbi:MAG TPA: thiamine phosphate synthase [Xanthobacteraceae bacterium]|nr:thiamine phosphate synthase [Xanthobacteraceae bacterium]